MVTVLGLGKCILKKVIKEKSEHLALVCFFESFSSKKNLACVFVDLEICGRNPASI